MSSPAGRSNLSHVFALFNTTAASTANACYVHYDASTNLVYLADNASTTWLGGFVPSSSGSIGNSQCTIAGTNSSPNPTSSGAQLGLTLTVTFQPSFAGTRNEYLYALDVSGVSTGWQQMGTWTVAAPPVPDFTLTTPMDTYYVQPGASTPSYTVTITPQNGFNSPVSFSASPLMYGCAYPSFTPVQVAGPPWTTTVTRSCYETLQIGTFMTVLATGGGKTHQLNLNLVVTQSQQVLLTTAVSPPGSGGIYPASGWYTSGTQVMVTAAANPGYQFTTFSGALTGGSPGYVIMNSNKSVTANFTQTAQYSLTTSVSPPGVGTITPSSGSYANGTQLQVLAAPAAGYAFAGFTGDLNGIALPQSLVMNGNKSVTANFVATPQGQYSLTTSVDTAGTGTITPGAGSFNSGSQVQVTAIAVPGYSFAGFSGDLNGTANPQVVTMSGNRSVKAVFLPSSLSVTCAATPTPAMVGQTVTFLATVSGGSPPYSYSWSGAVTGSNSSALFVPGRAGGYQAAVTVNSTASADCSTGVAEPALAAFRDCIGPNGTGDTCQLAPGTYEVPPFYEQHDSQGHPIPARYQQIGRSNMTITGTMTGGPADTVMRRGVWIATAPGAPPVSPDTYILRSAGVFTGVTIQYLTFDGNRYGAGLGCLEGNAPYWDLDLSFGAFLVQWVDFINAPGDALLLGTGSFVRLSNFGQGGPQTATRSTAIWLGGANDSALFNAISYAGTAGITLAGANHFVYGNLLQTNRYEISDGSQGGQIYLDGSSSGAYVAGNVIDGGNWPPQPAPPLVNGCAFVSGQFNAGVEAYGFAHRFFNNEIANHTGSGMVLAGSTPTGQITISSANPSDGFDSPRFIEQNRVGGISFLGTEWCQTSGFPRQCQPANGVILDAVLVRDNGGPSVNLDGMPDYGGYIGFVFLDSYSWQPNGARSDSCISGNLYNSQPADIPRGLNTLSFGFPTGYASYRGGTCPASAWPRLPAPASSHIPGWPW